MKNGPSRATFWKRFLAENCEYPAPVLLHDQLEHAEFTEFCECGCNSFGLRVSPALAKPLLPTTQPPGKGRRAIHTVDFKMPNDRTLEIVIFADAHGHLDYVEVDCCANSYPVPEEVVAEQPPFHVWSNETLYRE